MKRLCLAGWVLGAACAASSPVEAGRIVVANDEWTLSNTGFANAADTDTFVLNVADWFTGGANGNFLAYSSNFGLIESSLSATLTGAGHTWTVSTAVTFDLATLLGYDAVFLAGNSASNSVLIDYVNAGGNVYLAGGTGVGGAAAEAAQWNTFLNAFGLGFASVYNGVCPAACNVAIANPHPIFNGVSALYQWNGNNTLDLNLLDPQGQVLVTSGADGLYAVYDPVPEPGSMLLLGSGLGALWMRRRRR